MQFDIIVKPKTKWYQFDIKELIRYKDLIAMFVKRSFATLYKQTLFGPVWLFLNPLLTTVVSTVVFDGIAGLSTDGVPSFLFYLAGNSVWMLVSTNVNLLSTTFIANSSLYGKVYFPRLAVPISDMITNFFKFCIQMILFFVLFAYDFLAQNVHPNIYVLFFPLIVLQLSLLSAGIGVIVSSVTTKYRDLGIIVPFALTAWMYLSPVVYPMSMIGGLMRPIMWINPVTPALEIFRYGFFGAGQVNMGMWGLSWVTTLLVVFAGMALFNRTEKNFMDTV